MIRQNIRWGIVTAGRITHTFAHDMQFCSNAEIGAVAARRADDANAFAKHYGIPKAYEGYDALFADDEIDAIYVGSPHTFHVAHTEQALRAGKHVLCEKPITTCVHDLQHLISVATDCDRFLMEAMWTDFLPAIQQARQWVASGEIGELLHVKADFGSTMPYDPHTRVYNKALAGGCLLDMGIYPVAFNLYFHPEPGELTSVIKHYAPNGVEDDAIWQIKYANSTASLHCSFRCQLPNGASLIGTKGTIIIPDFLRAREAMLYEKETLKAHFRDDRKGHGFEFEIMHASSCIQAGKQQSDTMSWQRSLDIQTELEKLLNAG